MNIEDNEHCIAEMGHGKIFRNRPSQVFLKPLCVKAGIIEEIVGKNLPRDIFPEFEEEAAEGELDKVLGEILKDRMATAGKLPTASIAQKPIAATPQQEEEKDEEDNEAMIDQMRYGLEALGS